MIYIYTRAERIFFVCVGRGKQGDVNFFNNLIVAILRTKMKVLISTRKWTFTNCSLLPAQVFLFNSLIAVILQI